MLQTYKLQCNQGIGKSGNFCFCPIPSIPDPTQPYGFPTGTAGIPYNSHSHCRKCKLVPFPTLIGSGREWEWELRVGNDTLILALLFTMAGYRLNNTQLHYQWIHDSIVALQLLSIFLLETMSLSKSLNKIWSIKLPNYRNLYSHNHILCPLMCANIFWSTPSYQLCCNIMYWLNKSVIFIKVYKNFRDALANLTMVGIVYSSVT